MLVHGLHIAVTVALQILPKLIDIQQLAGLEHQAGSGDVVGGRQSVHQGRNRYHQNARCHSAQPMQRAQAFGNNILVGGKVVVGKGLPIGKGQDFHITSQEKRQLALQCQGRAGVSGNHHQQPVRLGELSDAARIRAASKGPQSGAGSLFAGPWRVFY